MSADDVDPTEVTVADVDAVVDAGDGADLNADAGPDLAAEGGVGTNLEADLDDDADDEDDEDRADPNAVPAANARSVLEYLVRSVVDQPDAVQISVSGGQRVTSLDVRVGDGDMGRVIGKRGRIAQAIRTVVRAAAVKDGVAVDIEFVD